MDLIVVPDLPAADKAAAGVADTKIGPPSASVNADRESGPVIEQRDWRRRGSIGRTARRIGGFGCCGHGCEHHRRQTKLDQPVLAHLRPPSVKYVRAHKDGNCGVKVAGPWRMMRISALSLGYA